MSTNVKLYRKRFIPDETVYLKDDEILFSNSQLIITKWTCLHPRKDIARGFSAYCLTSGFKINKIYNASNQLVYWYCDIIRHDFEASTNSLIVTDLLVDIIVYPDGTSRVLDLEEVADCLNSGVISVSTASEALKKTHQLLDIIYSNAFSSYQSLINEYDTLGPPS